MYEKSYLVISLDQFEELRLSAVLKHNALSSAANLPIKRETYQFLYYHRDDLPAESKLYLLLHVQHGHSACAILGRASTACASMRTITTKPMSHTKQKAAYFKKSSQ